MLRKSLGEELNQMVRQMENRCYNRNETDDTDAWKALIGNPIMDDLPLGFSYYNNELVLQGCNRKYSDYLRSYTPFSPRRALGMCFFDYKPGSATYSEKWMRHVRDSGKSVTRYDLPLSLTIDGQKSTSYWDAHFVPIKDETGSVAGLIMFSMDITEQKLATEAIQEKGDALADYSQYVEELKRTVRVLMDLKDEDSKVLEEDIACNVQQLLIPYIEKMKQTLLSAEQESYLNAIESTLRSLVAPTSRVLSSENYNLSPTEIQIVGFIREGKISKEIADLMGVSKASIDFHRNNIRKKLNLNNKKINLRTYLSSPAQGIAPNKMTKTRVDA